MRKSHIFRSALIGSLLATTAVVPAMAQIDEIIVTATKRNTSLNDTPISISAFDGEMMDELGISGAADIANLTPGMTYNGSPNRIFIRGVGRVDNSLGTEPGIAIYRDGIYINEAASVSDNSFFVERIEVLRGPQGTLFGRNAIGGAANVISKRPTEEFTGQARARVGSFNEQYVGLALSGPLTDNFRYRVAFERNQNDGWVKNIAGPNQNSLNFERVDAQLEWDVTDRLNIWMNYQDYEWDQGSGGTVGIDPYNTTNPGAPVFDFNFQSLVLNSGFGYGVARPTVNDLHTVNYDNGGYIDNPGHYFTSHVTYNADTWQLKYTYGQNSYEWNYEVDYDGTSRADINYTNYIGQHEDYNQHELTWTSDFGGDVELLFGLFKYHDENYQPYDLRAPDLAVLDNPVWVDFYTPAAIICACVIDTVPNPDRNFYHQSGTLETDAYAAYGQLDFQVNDQIHIAAGMRWSRDEKVGLEDQRVIFDEQGAYAAMMPFYQEFFDDGGAINFGTLSPYPAFSYFNAAGYQTHFSWDLYGGPRSARHESSWESIDWSLGIDYKPTDDSMYYGKVSTAYKAGGFRLGSMQYGEGSFEGSGVVPEELIAYELGFKNTYNDNFQLNGVVYLYNYENMQVPVTQLSGVGVAQTIFYNADKAEQWGIEFDAQWHVNESLTLYSTYTFMDTEISNMGQNIIDTTDADTTPQDVSGNNLIKAPEHKFTMNGHYTWFMESGNTIAAALTYVYTADQDSNIFNTAMLRIPSFNRIDARLTYRRPEDGVRISAYVRNATDEDIIESMTRSSTYFNNARSASIQPGRWLGVEVNIDF